MLNERTFSYYLNSFQKRKLFDLQEASMGVKFYLYYDSIEEKVFVSMPAEKVVIKLEPKEMEITLVAGTSQACKGNLGCGDSGKAKEAQLSYPKVSPFNALLSAQS